MENKKWPYDNGFIGSDKNRVRLVVNGGPKGPPATDPEHRDDDHIGVGAKIRVQTGHEVSEAGDETDDV